MSDIIRADSENLAVIINEIITNLNSGKMFDVYIRCTALDKMHLGQSLEFNYKSKNELMVSRPISSVVDFFDMYDSGDINQIFNVSINKILHLLYYFYAILNNTLNDSLMIPLIAYNCNNDTAEIFVIFDDTYTDEFLKEANLLDDDDLRDEFIDLNINNSDENLVYCPDEKVIERISNVIFSDEYELADEYSKFGRLDKLLEFVKMDMVF